MKKYKVYFCVISAIFIFFIIPFSTSFAKYVLTESMLVANINIDRTKPKLQVTYSTETTTNGSVIVTIKANEEIQEIEGWKLQEDKKTLIKEYEENIVEEIKVKDISGNETSQTINIDQIDKEAPVIKIAKITNSNKEYPQYANKDKTITILLSITDNRSISNLLKESDIKIIIDNKEVNPKEKKLEYEKNEVKEKIAKVTLSGIEEEGILKIQIPSNIVQDSAGNSNQQVKEDINIIIDNTKPSAIYSQNKIEAGKIQAIITANEDIRKLEGWKIENNKILKKEFNNNLSYTTIIQDLAGNQAEVEINITGATNVILSYASHNSMVGWSYGYGNYDIAGEEAIKENDKYKTESLAFSISGNVEKDYLQARAFVYTHWGEGSKAQCDDTKRIYTYGWNPSSTNWKYETEENKINLNGRTYFQLGGAGVNGEGKTDLNGNGKISKELMNEFRYGISAIQLKLKNYDDNSILYQIYIKSVGWLKPAKNEELACYAKTSPISAIRIALVPNSEVQAVYDSWSKDCKK